MIDDQSFNKGIAIDFSLEDNGSTVGCDYLQNMHIVHEIRGFNQIVEGGKRRVHNLVN
jgi:hypothetical protein